MVIKASKLSRKKKKDNYFNRELSWLEFNWRVLQEASNKKTPLLEKLKFLAIYSSNLDEFVMKRVGGLKGVLKSNPHKISIDGLDPKEQLELIREKIIHDNKVQEKIFFSIKAELGHNGIKLCSWDKLNINEQEYCNEYFYQSLYPILTPLSVDAGRPFPFISNLSYSLGVYIENPITQEEKFARVKIPSIIHKWIFVPSILGGGKYINTADIISNNLDKLFCGMQIKAVMPFRITRSADWKYDNEDSDDLLESIEESINTRRLLAPIRIECLEKNNPKMLSYLMDALNLTANDLFYYQENLEFSFLFSLVDIKGTSLKNKPWKPITPKEFKVENIFDAIVEKDHLLHHPYENFKTSVERFICDASEDPNVLSIKMSLYRTEEDSPFIGALINAAEKGVQVVCLIELKARFDEKRNIKWARKMEEAGVHVVYGIVGLKTHTKIAMVVRKEASGSLLRYAHIGTGNYNSATANIYTDLGLLTTDERLTLEINEVFNYLTGTSLLLDYKHLLVSPINAKSKFLLLIQKQIIQKQNGQQAYIFAKMNSLEDTAIIEALYEASKNGVKIDLVVRGVCCLRPNIKDLSENIQVISVVGRFLEHSRIYFFSDGGKNKWQGHFYIGSADWMQRNMHARVEVITPIYAIPLKEKLAFFLETLLEDQVKAWVLNQDGSYTHLQGGAKTATHSVMMKNVKEKTPIKNTKLEYSLAVD